MILLPFGGLVNFLFTILIPSFESIRVIFPDTKEWLPSTLTEVEDKKRDIELWLVYWMFIAIFGYTVDLLLPYIPLLFEIRLLVLGWLYHPSFRGTLLLVDNAIKRPELRPLWVFLENYKKQGGKKGSKFEKSQDEE